MKTRTRSLLIFLLVLASLFLVAFLPTLAMAADAPSTAASAGFVSFTDAALRLFGTVIGLLLSALLARLVQRAGLTLTQGQAAAYDDAITGAIHYAEEQAHKKFVELSQKMPANEKLNTAVQFAISEIEHLGLEQKAEEWIRSRIHSRLGFIRSENPPAQAAPPAPTPLRPVA